MQYQDIAEYVSGLVGSGDELQVKVRSRSNELREHGVVPIDPTRGRFLELIARIKSPRRVLEIGSGAGYSALWFMKGMGERGKLETIEVNPEVAGELQKVIERAGLQGRIKVHRGVALEILRKLKGRYDIVFIDADKDEYPQYLKYAMKLTSVGSIILADNLLWGGSTFQPGVQREGAEGIIEYTKRIFNDARLSSLLIPLGDGLGVSFRVKQPPQHGYPREIDLSVHEHIFNQLSNLYHEGNRKLQDQFDTRRMANRIEEVLVSDRLTDYKELIETRDMFFLATADDLGHPNCSYKGGAPGFVRVVDEHTLAFPNYDGNGMYLSMGNVLRNPHVGILFIDLEEGNRLRVNGLATIDPHDQLMAEYPEAQFIVRVRATHVFPNCPRYIHQYQLIERSKFVPKKGCKTPVPEWKRSDWAVDVLPEGDPARST